VSIFIAYVVITGVGMNEGTGVGSGVGRRARVGTYRFDLVNFIYE
jgi:hypothetical protein